MRNVEKSEYLYKIRHSAEHIFNQAIEELWPGKILRAIGPAIDNGFYNDSRWAIEISEEKFPEIEKRMTEIVEANLPFIRRVVSESEARGMFKDNPFKQELITEFISDGQDISVYYTGDPDKTKDVFVDLCAGPHVDSTGEVKAFKLLSVAGAYWRGNEKNEMLTRVYGTAFESEEELQKYLDLVEEAKKRDHRKLGRELDLFTFSDLVGAGLPLYTEKGTTIKNELYRSLLQISKKYGVQEVSIPHMAKIDLYKISGHADKFADELFHVISHHKEEFVLKPVNCPHHTQIYASRPRSYRDLPIRYIESTQQHRDEKPGQIGGLIRTRSFTVDDGHTFCTVDQIKQEAINTCKIIEEFYRGIGLWGKHWVSLSIRDPKTPEKYIGESAGWEKAESMIKEVSDELGLNGIVQEGEAAIYGPKIDFMFKDALGNERQLATVQIDFAMPERFGLSYTSQSGEQQTPVMLHRAILGSYERFLAIIIEHFAGAFPVWLSPVQVRIITISEKSNQYGCRIRDTLLENNIRVELDDSAETMGNKIRKAQEQKVPYMLIVGGKEEESQTVSIRYRNGKQANLVDLAVFTDEIKRNIMSKSIEV